MLLGWVKVSLKNYRYGTNLHYKGMRFESKISTPLPTYSPPCIAIPTNCFICLGLDMLSTNQTIVVKLCRA
jgi:hypothetical protein